MAEKTLDEKCFDMMADHPTISFVGMCVASIVMTGIIVLPVLFVGASLTARKVKKDLSR